MDSLSDTLACVSGFSRSICSCGAASGATIPGGGASDATFCSGSAAAECSAPTSAAAAARRHAPPPLKAMGSGRIEPQCAGGNLGAGGIVGS